MDPTPDTIPIDVPPSEADERDELRETLEAFGAAVTARTLDLITTRITRALADKRPIAPSGDPAVDRLLAVIAPLLARPEPEPVEPARAPKGATEKAELRKLIMESAEVGFAVVDWKGCVAAIERFADEATRRCNKDPRNRRVVRGDGVAISDKRVEKRDEDEESPW